MINGRVGVPSRQHSGDVRAQLDRSASRSSSLGQRHPGRPVKSFRIPTRTLWYRKTSTSITLPRSARHLDADAAQEPVE